MPIEDWPVCTLRDSRYRGWTLDDLQHDRENLRGDRHAIVLDPVNRLLYKFFVMNKTT